MRQVVKIVAGVNLVAGCLLMQGCGSYGTKGAGEGAVIQNDLDDNIAIIADGAAGQPVAPVAGVGAISFDAAVADVLPATTPYTIKKGDTISAVAYKYGLRWQDVVAINPGISPNKLRIGQVIHLPGAVNLEQVRQMPATTPKKSAAPVVTPPKTTAAAAATGATASYVVKKGDSLSVIAVRYGTTAAAIRDANGIKGDKILVGQKLIIPGATKTPAATAVAAPAKAATKAAASAQTRPPVVESKAVEAKPPHKVVTPPPPPAVSTPEAKAVESPAVAVPPPPAAPVQPVQVEAPVVDENVQMYTVKEDEDVYAIAIRWGVSPAAIKSLNNLTSNDLKAGMTLKIPTANQ